MEFPPIPAKLSLKKLYLVGSGQLTEESAGRNYVRAAQRLKGWLGSEAFERGVAGLAEAVLERVGKDTVRSLLEALEERGLGLSPGSVREALRLKGVEASAGFAELLYKCLKQAGMCVSARATLPASSAESGVMALLKLKSTVEFSELSRSFPNAREAVLSLLRKGLVTVTYRRASLSLEGVSNPDELPESEVGKIPEAFLARVEGFGGRVYYRVAIPSRAKVGLKWA